MLIKNLYRTPQDLFDVFDDLLGTLSDCNVKYAEVFVSPLIYPRLGFHFEPIIEGLLEKRCHSIDSGGPRVNFLFDVIRQWGETHAMDVIDAAIKYRDKGVVGLEIGGDERISPREFINFARRAYDEGFPLTVHAGEACGADSIIDAIEFLHTKRIGHGISAINDKDLMKRLADEDICLEVCPTSNAKTGVVSSLNKHPLPELLAAKIPVCINSDDPGLFSTDLLKEIRVAMDVLGISEEGIEIMNTNAINHAFEKIEKGSYA